MTEERDDQQEEVQVPDDAVEDLELDADESRDVQGGELYNWWKKTQ